jgi:DNA-binding transcriptional ArsR family regulator
VNPTAGQAGLEPAAVLLTADCRSLRRQLRPLVWVTLEEVALDAAAEGGRLVAHTSARQVAERLRMNPSTAAGALRMLRDRGLITLEREHGQGGRFGLSIYAIGDLPGLTIVPPRVARPQVVSPHLENPPSDVPRPGVDGPHTVRPQTTEPGTGEANIDDLPPSPSLQCRGQEAFDLGSVSS